MKIKGKRVLKNGAVAGYVWKDRKWKWRIIKGPSKKRGGGPRTCEFLEKNRDLIENHPFYEKYYNIMCTKNNIGYYGKVVLNRIVGSNSKLAELGLSIGNKNAFLKESRLNNRGVAYKISKPGFEIKLEKWVNGKPQTQMTSQEILDELDNKVKDEAEYFDEAEAKAQAEAEAKKIIKKLYDLGLKNNKHNELTIKKYIRNYLINEYQIKRISRNATRNQQNNFNRKWKKLLNETNKTYTNIKPYL